MAHASDRPLTPRALDAFITQRSPLWVSQFLRTRLPDLSLEDLFANCWVLGRIADTAHSLLNEHNGRAQTPPASLALLTPNLSDRPYRAVLHDIERFHALCDALDISQDSRITLADVEQRKAGTRIGLCLWDCSVALREKGLTAQVPEFAPTREWRALRHNAASKEVNRAAVEHFERATDALLLRSPSPTLPTRLGDGAGNDGRSVLASPWRQQRHSLRSTSESENGNEDEPSPATATTRLERRSGEEIQEQDGEDEYPLTPATLRGTHATNAGDPPSLHQWLAERAGAGTSPDSQVARGGKPSSAPSSLFKLDRGALNDAVSPLTLRPSNHSHRAHSLHPSQQGGYQGKDGRSITSASNANDCGGFGEDDGLILQAILSPEKLKPAHTQLLNAIIRSTDHDNEASIALNSASAQATTNANDDGGESFFAHAQNHGEIDTVARRSRRKLGLTPRFVGVGGAGSGEGLHRDQGLELRNDATANRFDAHMNGANRNWSAASFVRVMSVKQPSGGGGGGDTNRDEDSRKTNRNDRRRQRERGNRGVLMPLVGVGVALVVAAAGMIMQGRKKSERNVMRVEHEEGAQASRHLRHQGRW